jgi:hypothetical protein
MRHNTRKDAEWRCRKQAGRSEGTSFMPGPSLFRYVSETKPFVTLDSNVISHHRMPDLLASN